MRDIRKKKTKKNINVLSHFGFCCLGKTKEEDQHIVVKMFKALQ